MRKCKLLIAALLTCAGCSEEAADSDDLAGTGSAGGNPLALTLAFDYDGQTDRDSLEWGPPTLNIGEMRVTIGGEDWACSTPTEPTSVDESYTLDELTEFVFSPPQPCGIILNHPANEPLIVSEAEFGENRTVRVEIWGELRIRIDDLSDIDVGQDVFFILGLDHLIDELDFEQALETETLVVYSDRPDDSNDAGQVQTNFVAAARIYLDPTPGDHEITRAERTRENIVGNAQLAPER